MNTQANVLFTAPGNLFLRLTVEYQTAITGGTNPGDNSATDVYNVQRFQTLTPVYATGSVIDTTQAISVMDLYINNIFVNPEINKNGF